jgi:hypothetical protein
MDAENKESVSVSRGVMEWSISKDILLDTIKIRMVLEQQVWRLKADSSMLPIIQGAGD